MLKNPPFYSSTSFSIVLPMPSNKMPDFSRALIIFIMLFMSSSSIINLIYSPRIFFCIPPSIADIAAVNHSAANTFLANDIATFINGPAILLNKLPKKPPDLINFFSCALLNFILCSCCYLLRFLI